MMNKPLIILDERGKVRAMKLYLQATKLKRDMEQVLRENGVIVDEKEIKK